MADGEGCNSALERICQGRVKQAFEPGKRRRPCHPKRTRVRYLRKASSSPNASQRLLEIHHPFPAEFLCKMHPNREPVHSLY